MTVYRVNSESSPIVSLLLLKIHKAPKKVVKGHLEAFVTLSPAFISKAVRHRNKVIEEYQMGSVREDLPTML